MAERRARTRNINVRKVLPFARKTKDDDVVMTDTNGDGGVGTSKRKGGSQYISKDGQFGVSIYHPNWEKVDENHLKNWLLRKCRLKIQVLKTFRKGKDHLIMMVPNIDQQKSLLHLNHFSYLGTTISVTEYAIYNDEASQKVLGEFVTSRYNLNEHFLNFSNLMEEKPLMEFFNQKNTLYYSEWNVLFKTVARLFPQIRSIDFSKNKLRSLVHLRGLKDILPNVQNLSFANNEIASFNSLEALKSLKGLREVLFIENPVYENAVKQNRMKEYRKQILRIFPNLTLLDSVFVEEEIKVSSSTENTLPAKLPAEIRGNFFDSLHTKTTVEEFLLRFLSAFDQDRQSLIDVYANNSFFSLTVHESYPVAVQVSKNPKKYLNKERDYTLLNPKDNSDIKLQWNKANHNLDFIKDPKLRQSHIYSGPLNIVHLFTQLPKTQHQHPQTFKIDSWQIGEMPNKNPTKPPLPPRLFINIHGIFTDVHNKIDRYFDRSFVLVPALPNSKAVLLGWPIQIVNDQLNIFSVPPEEIVKKIQDRYTEALTFQLIKQETLLPPIIGATPPQEPTTEQKQEWMVNEFSKVTGLNLQVSLQCLMEQNWDADKAMLAFKEAQTKNIIPKEAFLK